VKIKSPTTLVFWISVVLAVVGVIAYLVTIPVLSGLAFWLVVVGFALLVAGLLVKGL
jgi:hypothetical protein